MNDAPIAPLAGEAGPQAESLSLKSSSQLGRVPAEHPAAPPSPAVEAVPAAAVVVPPPVPMTVSAQPLTLETLPQRLRQPTPPLTWGVTSVALIAAVGWLYERRRRRLIEMEKDSVMWADVQQQHGPSIVTTAGGLDDILPDSPDPGEAARAIYVTAIGDTNSRREATLIDLHQLNKKLTRRREHGDVVAAVLLLQQHLVDFRYTSPWVFLELRELYKALGRAKEWDDAREVFKNRFGQNAPVWETASTADAELVADAQLCGDVVRMWPFRPVRMFILRWMLGDNDARHRNAGPPLLGLGIYRDMMFLDTVLDEALETLPVPPADSLL